MEPPEDTAHRHVGFGLLTLGVSLVLCLVLAETVARVLALGVTYQVGEHQIRLDPEVLYRNVPASSPELNHLGYREREFDRRKGHRNRVLFVGDSFLAAWGVPQPSMVTRVLERRLGDDHEVYSMGVSGYGPDQGLLRMLEEGFDYEPDRVVLALFAANDFNDLDKNDLFELDPGGQLVRTDSNPVSRFLPPLRLFAFAQTIAGSGVHQQRADELFQLLFHDTYDTLLDESAPDAVRKIALMRAVLSRFRDESRLRGVSFAVAIIPSSWGIEGFGPPEARPTSAETAFRNEDLAEALCRSLDIPSVDLTDALRGHPDQRLYLSDGHWSVAGHALAGQAIAEALFARGSGRR